MGTTIASVSAVSFCAIFFFFFLLKPLKTKVFLDISSDGQPVGRLVVEVYTRQVPKTAQKFIDLCVGKAPPLFYKGCLLDRIAPNQMICAGGAWQNEADNVDISAYDKNFHNENANSNHDQIGLITMFNSVQFGITLCGADTASPGNESNRNNNESFGFMSSLNGRNVIVGKIVEGLDDVLPLISNVAVDDKGRPLADIIISNCGKLTVKSYFLDSDKNSKSDGKEVSVNDRQVYYLNKEEAEKTVTINVAKRQSNAAAIAESLKALNAASVKENIDENEVNNNNVDENEINNDATGSDNDLYTTNGISKRHHHQSHLTDDDDDDDRSHINDDCGGGAMGNSNHTAAESSFPSPMRAEG